MLLLQWILLRVLRDIYFFLSILDICAYWTHFCVSLIKPWGKWSILNHSNLPNNCLSPTVWMFWSLSCLECNFQRNVRVSLSLLCSYALLMMGEAAGAAASSTPQLSQLQVTSKSCSQSAFLISFFYNMFFLEFLCLTRETFAMSMSWFWHAVFVSTVTQ